MFSIVEALKPIKQCFLRDEIKRRKFSFSVGNSDAYDLFCGTLCFGLLVLGVVGVAAPGCSNVMPGVDRNLVDTS
jgi:hypothetical protein